MKVKNKLDNRTYAVCIWSFSLFSFSFAKIKIVGLQGGNSEKILSEVHTLAKLSESCNGVVRYYNAWIDTSLDETSFSKWRRESNPVVEPETHLGLASEPRIEQARDATMRGASVYLNSVYTRSGTASDDGSIMISETPSELERNDALSRAPTEVWECQVCHQQYHDWYLLHRTFSFSLKKHPIHSITREINDENWQKIPAALQAFFFGLQSFQKDCSL